MFAGNARLTLKSRITGTWFTYSVIRTRINENMYFVSVLTHNNASYRFLGIINDKRIYKHATKKSFFPVIAPSVQAFRWFLDRLKGGYIPPELEVWHEGKCGRCGKKLTTPESIETGLGPVCSKRGEKYAPPLCST